MFAETEWIIPPSKKTFVPTIEAVRTRIVGVAKLVCPLCGKPYSYPKSYSKHDCWMV